MSNIDDKLKIEYEKYLNKLSINSLQSLGRHLGVHRPSDKRKAVLIADIINVRLGAVEPCAPTNRGAPLKSEPVSEEILMDLQKIEVAFYAKEETFSIKSNQEKARNLALEFDELFRKHLESEKNVLVVEDPSLDERRRTENDDLFLGQLKKFSKVSCLLPLNYTDLTDNAIIMDSFIARYQLKEGDVVSARVKEENGMRMVTAVETINTYFPHDLKRRSFEESEICLPTKKLSFAGEKFIEWFCPIARGQRCLIEAAPKTGKTHYLKKLAKAASCNNAQIMILLVEESPENIFQFKQELPFADIVATNYGDEAELQVFFAEMLLERAKRAAECGRDVILFIDSLTSLAKAYDETLPQEKLSVCNLETKTLRYIKKYIGSARALLHGGSLSILTTVSTETGDENDDLFIREVSSIFTTKIKLDLGLALKRIFPAIDALHSRTDLSEQILSEVSNEIDLFIRKEYLPIFGSEKLLSLIADCDTAEELYQRAKLQLNQ